MNKIILWFLGAASLCIGGWALYRFFKPVPQTEQPRTEEPKSHEQPTREQALLEVLQQQRTLAVELACRDSCGRLFRDLSACIQNLLAQEQRSCSKDSVFCRRLTVIAENESLSFRLETREPRPMPLPLTEEEKNADAETLEALLQQEQPASRPAADFPWEKVVEDLLPCLENLLRFSEAGDAAKCREQLKALRETLERHSIHPLWYQELEEPMQEVLYWKFVHAPGYPIPALFYQTEGQSIHVGTPGRTGETIP